MSGKIFTKAGRKGAIDRRFSEAGIARVRVDSNAKSFTPEIISELQPGEVFVFGSNLLGHHAGGAARVACNRFGAKWGVGVGLQGQSYAIPTMQGGVETIRPYVDQFIDFARLYPHTTFLVTPIGCGIAGFTPAQIAPLFRRALEGLCQNASFDTAPLRCVKNGLDARRSRVRLKGAY